MKDTLKQLVNQQINEELFSSYAYLAISARAELLSLKGFANWFRVQAQEEIGHAMGFYKHLADRGEVIELGALAKPELKLDGAQSLIEASLAHEKHITAKIHELMDAAKAEKDYALESLLKWYVDEQLEEEANIGELLEKVKLVGDKGDTLFILDKELGEREYVAAKIN